MNGAGICFRCGKGFRLRQGVASYQSRFLDSKRVELHKDCAKAYDAEVKRENLTARATPVRERIEGEAPEHEVEARYADTNPFVELDFHAGETR